MPANGGNSIRFELGIRNTSALATNFRKRSEAMTEAVRDAVQVFAENTHEIAYTICPVDTSPTADDFAMRDHIRTEFSPDGFAVDIGWRAEDFFNEGLPFYPWYVTQGTRKMPARPVLEPAYRITKPELLSDLRDIMRSGGK